KTNRMKVNLSFCNHWMARYLTKRQKSAFFTFTILCHLTFHQISRHPMVVKDCIIAHSNCLVKTNRMTVNSSFYNHWMTRYLTKRQKIILRHLTFRQISGLLVIVEGQIYRHSIRLDETIQMSYGTAVYDHWMVIYLTKRQ